MDNYAKCYVLGLFFWFIIFTACAILNPSNADYYVIAYISFGCMWAYSHHSCGDTKSQSKKPRKKARKSGLRKIEINEIKSSGVYSIFNMNENDCISNNRKKRKRRIKILKTR